MPLSDRRAVSTSLVDSGHNRRMISVEHSGDIMQGITLLISVPDNLVVPGGKPRQLTENPVIVKACIFHPAAVIFAAMGVGLHICTALQLKILQQPDAHHAASYGATVKLHGIGILMSIEAGSGISIDEPRSMEEPMSMPALIPPDEEVPGERRV